MREPVSLKRLHFGSRAKLAIYWDWNVGRYVLRHWQHIPKNLNHTSDKTTHHITASINGEGRGCPPPAFRTDKTALIRSIKTLLKARQLLAYRNCLQVNRQLFSRLN